MGVREASDVVALPGGRFAVVSDSDDHVFLVDEKNGAVAKAKLHKVPDHGSALEGIAYDPVSKNLFVARESTGELFRFQFNPNDGSFAFGESRVIQSLIDGNKGCEGLAFVPGPLSPTHQPLLLAVKEARPKRLLTLRANGTGKPSEVALDAKTLAAVKDFSAVAVDPKTGDLFIASDESSAVVQVHLQKKGSGWIGAFVQSYPLTKSDGSKFSRIEGLTFDERGAMWVLTENGGNLHQFSRK